MKPLLLLLPVVVLACSTSEQGRSPVTLSPTPSVIGDLTFWCPNGGIKPAAANPFVVPPSPADGVWSRLVMHTGSGQAVANAVVDNPQPGKAYTHTSGGQIDAVILCLATTGTTVATVPEIQMSDTLPPPPSFTTLPPTLPPAPPPARPQPQPRVTVPPTTQPVETAPPETVPFIVIPDPVITMPVVPAPEPPGRGPDGQGPPGQEDGQDDDPFQMPTLPPMPTFGFGFMNLLLDYLLGV